MEKLDANVKCANCNAEISDEKMHKIHLMTHLLMDKLNMMPPQYGALAMIQLLITNSPYSKEEFIQVMSDAWDEYK